MYKIPKRRGCGDGNGANGSDDAVNPQIYRAPIEEKRLADDRHDRFRPEGLGDQKSRFRAVTRQQTLGIGGNEDHRHLAFDQDFIHRVQTGASVRQMDVGQHQPGRVFRDRRHGFLAGSGNPRHAMPQIGHQSLQIHGDNRLVLDNQDIGAQLGGDFVTRLLQQGIDLVLRSIQDLGDLLGLEAFLRAQQEGYLGRGVMASSVRSAASAAWKAGNPST